MRSDEEYFYRLAELLLPPHPVRPTEFKRIEIHEDSRESGVDFLKHIVCVCVDRPDKPP
jgi:hypothetical protein